MSQPTLPRARQGIDYGDEPNVQNLHATLERENGGGGRVTIKPFSIWMLAVCGFVFFFAGYFSARSGADYTATSAESGNPAPAQAILQAVQPGAGSASAVQSTVAEPNAPGIVHLAMKNMKFDPPQLEIHKGDTVEWTNDDITPHTATATPFFDSGSIASDKSWRHTFTEAGSFPYGCTFHPDMKAVVLVK